MRHNMYYPSPRPPLLTPTAKGKDTIVIRVTSYTKCLGTHLRETEKAVHFRVEQVGDQVLDESKTLWFPFSQINSQTHNPTVDSTDMVEVADWLLVKAELI